MFKNACRNYVTLDKNLSFIMTLKEQIFSIFLNYCFKISTLVELC